MGLLVRERPSLQLAVDIATPNSGPVYRWGADDPNVQNKANAITFGTTMPGGFDQGAVTLQRDPRIDWPDLIEFSTVTFRGLGGAAVAWQGRVEEFPSQAGSQAAFTPTLVGWQSHLQDQQDAAMVFIDRLVSSWGGPTVRRQIALINSANAWGLDTLSDQVGVDLNNKIALIFSGATPWTSNQMIEAWYGPAIAKLARIQASGVGQVNTSYQVDTNATNNALDLLNIYFCSDDVATAFNGVTGFSSPSLGANASPAEPYGLIQLQLVASATSVSGSPPDGSTVGVVFENLAAIGNHGLTLQTGASGSSPSYDDGYLASDVIAYVMSQWATKIAYTTGAAGTIQPSSFVIPQLVFTPTTPLAIIQAATQFELLDYAVWEQTAGTSGPTLYVNARGARGKQWTARVGPAQLQNAGPQVTRIFNGVIVQWQNVDGTTQSVGPPGSLATFTSSSLVDSDPLNPANVAGITRWCLLIMGTSTLAAATQVGAIFLQEQALVNTSGQAQLVGHVQDTSGVYWPAWMVRAGDTIQFVDAAQTGARRIVSASYSHTSRTNTLQLDSPPDGLEALLDRLSASIAFAGFQ